MVTTEFKQRDILVNKTRDVEIEVLFVTEDGWVIGVERLSGKPLKAELGHPQVWIDRKEGWTKI